MFSDTELEEMAILAIYNYYGGTYTKDYIKTNFGLAVKVLVKNATELLTRRVGVTSVSQGSRSESYDSSVNAFYLTSDVLALLPRRLGKITCY